MITSNTPFRMKRKGGILFYKPKDGNTQIAGCAL